MIILDIGFCTRNQGRLDRRTGVSRPAGRTAAIVRAGLPAVPIWAGAGTRPVMADHACRQRLGRADARRPASSDWREYLHYEGREDDRKKLPQPPTHESSHLLTKKLIMRADGCRAGTMRPYFCDRDSAA